MTKIAIESDFAIMLGADVKAAKIGSHYANKDFTGKIAINNIEVSGSIIFSNPSGCTVGGVAGKLYTSGTINLTVNNCKNTATLKFLDDAGNSNYTAGIFTSGTDYKILKNCSLDVKNNVNSGDIYNKGTITVNFFAEEHIWNFSKNSNPDPFNNYKAQ